jgi:hypothetical protein
VIKLSNSHSRAKWAELISNAWREQLTSIFQTGDLLTAAKAELAHGEWAALFKENEVPFSQSMANKLMAISGNELLRNSEHVPNLPVAWGTLYALTKLTSAQFADGIKSGAIHPKMQRKAVRELRGLEPNRKDESPKLKPRDLKGCVAYVRSIVFEALEEISTDQHSFFFSEVRAEMDEIEKKAKSNREHGNGYHAAC